MEAMTPASPDSLPPLGELTADDPFWRYPIGTGGESAAHLRMWLTTGADPGHLAVVTETGTAALVTRSAGHIWAELARRYGASVVLLEHHLAPEAGEGLETLDLVRIGADGSPHWLRVWPTPEENPRQLDWSSGWPFTGIRSSVSRRAGSTGAGTRTSDDRAKALTLRWQTPEWRHPGLASRHGYRGHSLCCRARNPCAGGDGAPDPRGRGRAARCPARCRRGPGAPGCRRPEPHIMAAAHELVDQLVAAEADPPGKDSPVLVLARAGALALISKIELEGTLQRAFPAAFAGIKPRALFRRKGDTA